jgi:hypothetical protein
VGDYQWCDHGLQAKGLPPGRPAKFFAHQYVISEIRQQYLAIACRTAKNRPGFLRRQGTVYGNLCQREEVLRQQGLQRRQIQFFGSDRSKVFGIFAQRQRPNQRPETSTRETSATCFVVKSGI